MGGPLLAFEPPNVLADVGDVVTFNFTFLPNLAVTHTVTQTSYDAPCSFLEGGFSSPAGYVGFETFSLEVLSTDRASLPVCQAIADAGAL